MAKKPAKQHRWYLGGAASIGATLFTHPLDLLKVHLQCQQEVKLGFYSMFKHVLNREGAIGLYQGLSAAIMRQATYSSVRFGVYELGRQHLSKDSSKPLPFYQKVGLAVAGGLCGGIVGNPSDVVNVRMQADIRRPPELRRCYKHVFDGYRRIALEEGGSSLFAGLHFNVVRGVLMTMGQMAVYDQTKQLLLATGYLQDNLITHFSASLIAGGAATTLTMPVDVLKTRMMNATPGDFQNVVHLLRYTSKIGPKAFFKGFTPAFIRLAPQTILTFIFLEQLRLLFPIR